MNNSGRICFVSDFFISDKNATITGPMVQTYLIGSELKKRGWDVHYIAYSKEGKDRRTEIYEGLTVHWIRHRRFLPLLQYFKIRQLLNRIDADTHYQRGRDILTGFVARYCKKKQKRFIWASAGESGVERGKYLRQVLKKRRPFFNKIVLWIEAKINDRICEYGIKNASQIVVQTAYQKGKLKEAFGLDSVVIKSGHPVPQPVERTLPLKVLWIGSIKAVKRPELFIQLAELCSGMNCEFWIAGQFVDSKIQSFLLQKIKKMNNLKYVGAIPFQESQSLISKAHVLVNTTDDGYEGLPNAFVQAWLAGTVTLSLHSDPDGVIEQYGLGARVESVSWMKKEIEKFTQEPEYWGTMSTKARNFGIKNFSIKIITDQLCGNLLV